MTPSEEDLAYAALREHKDKQRGQRKVKVNQPKVKKPTEEERRQLIREGLMRKKECEAKAVSIVERLAGAHQDKDELEAFAVDKEWLQDASCYLTPDHYSDAVTERALSGLCGLAVCHSRGVVDPKRAFDDKRQMFSIDSRTNRVFDIRERRKFCSDDCFKRSSDFAAQLSSEPLWMRKHDGDDKEKFRARLADAKQLQNICGKGDEVSLNPISRRDLETEISRGQAEQGWKNKNGNNNLKRTEILDETNVDQPKSPGIKAESDQVKPETPQDSPPKSPARARMRHKPRPKPKQVEIDPPLVLVKNAVSSWLTLDSLRLLAEGDPVQEEALKCRLRAADCPEEVMASLFGDQSPSSELERKLDSLVLEREEQEADSALQIDQEDEITKSALDIRQEVEEQNRKVQAFFAGRTEYEVENEKKTNENNTEADEVREPVLPLLDRHAQKAIRRKVVMEQIEKVLPDILQLCGGDPPLLASAVLSQVRRLVSTFSLDSTNVILRPREWILATVALLMLLSRSDSKLCSSLETPRARKHLGMMLLSYDTDMEGFREHLRWIMEEEPNVLTKIK